RRPSSFSVNIRPTGELDQAKNSLSVVLGFLGARGAVVISAVFSGFLRDWLWVFVSRWVGMSLAGGVTGVVLADGGWLEASPACGPIGCPWQDPIRRILTGSRLRLCCGSSRPLAALSP